jgi:hypothetical protein
MSDTFSRVEVITGVARRRRFATEQKLAVVAETMQPGGACCICTPWSRSDGKACSQLQGVAHQAMAQAQAGQGSIPSESLAVSLLSVIGDVGQSRRAWPRRHH